MKINAHECLGCALLFSTNPSLNPLHMQIQFSRHHKFKTVSFKGVFNNSISSKKIFFLQLLVFMHVNMQHKKEIPAWLLPTKQTPHYSNNCSQRNSLKKRYLNVLTTIIIIFTKEMPKRKLMKQKKMTKEHNVICICQLIMLHFSR